MRATLAHPREENLRRHFGINARNDGVPYLKVYYGAQLSPRNCKKILKKSALPPPPRKKASAMKNDTGELSETFQRVGVTGWFGAPAGRQLCQSHSAQKEFSAAAAAPPLPPCTGANLEGKRSRDDYDVFCAFMFYIYVNMPAAILQSMPSPPPPGLMYIETNLIIQLSFFELREILASGRKDPVCPMKED